MPTTQSGSRVRKAHHPDAKGDLGHVVAIFEHGGSTRYVIALWSPHKQRWLYDVAIPYSFQCGLWTVEIAASKEQR